MIFDETGKSTLTIAGVTFNPAGLGLARSTPGTDFTDNVLTGKVLTALNNASSRCGAGVCLRRQPLDRANSPGIFEEADQRAADRLGPLTLADSNEEAANSQALSTRQSIAVSALALANQSQQSVLQLLR